MHTGFCSGNLREERHLEGGNVDGKIILKRILKKWGEAMDWLDLARNRARWRALLNAVMNSRVP